MNAPVTVFTSCFNKGRVVFLIFIKSMMWAVIYTFVAFYTFILMNVYIKGHKMSNKFVWCIKNRWYFKMWDISCIFFINYRYKFVTICIYFFIYIFFKLKKSFNKWSNKSAVACRASVCCIIYCYYIFFSYYFCSNSICIAWP